MPNASVEQYMDATRLLEKCQVRYRVLMGGSRPDLENVCADLAGFPYSGPELAHGNPSLIERLIQFGFCLLVITAGFKESFLLICQKAVFPHEGTITNQSGTKKAKTAK